MPEPIRPVLRSALKEALLGRDRQRASTLRSALARIENAEAVHVPAATGPGDGPIAGTAIGAGAAEAERRSLTEADARTIVRSESHELRESAVVYGDAGETGRAQELTAAADLLDGLLTRSA